MKDLYEVIAKTLDLVTMFAIFYYYKYYIKIKDTSCLMLKYEIKQFMKVIYCSDRQIIDRSKMKNYRWYNLKILKIVIIAS